MRVESKVTSISWIPSEAVEGLPKVPFTMGVAHYDDAPPDRLVSIDLMHRADLFREANELTHGSMSRTTASSVMVTPAAAGSASRGSRWAPRSSGSLR